MDPGLNTLIIFPQIMILVKGQYSSHEMPLNIKRGRDLLMRGAAEGGVVVVVVWRQTGAGPFPASAAALTRKAVRQEGLCWQSRKTPPRSATLPKPRRRVVHPLLLPSSVCENLYQSRCATAGARLHVRIISQARKWWRGRAPRNHACGNMVVVGKIISTLL